MRPSELFGLVGSGRFAREFRWQDVALLRKCRIYDAYYRSGKEQSASGVFPRVCWLMPNAGRAERLRRAVQSERRLTTALFCVVTSDRALSTLTGVAT
jgi:hypothetical protein